MSNQNLPAVIQKAVSAQKIDADAVNLMLPTQTFGEVLGQYDKLTIEVVTVDPDPKQGDIYEPAYGKFALGQRPLNAISNAMGIVWDPQTTTILESTPMKSRAKATGAMRKANGEWIPLSDEKTIDLEVIEEELMFRGEQDTVKGEPYWENRQRQYRPWKSEEERQNYIEVEVKKALLQKKKFKDELAMTGAKERVIRKLLAIKSTYTKAELSKPFAFPRVTLDASKMLASPTARQGAIHRMMGSADAIFGPGNEREERDVTPAEETQDKPDATPEPTEGQPEEEQGSPPFDDVPWDETPEEIAQRKLKGLLEDPLLTKAPQEAIEEMLAKQEPSLKEMEELIERVESYLKKRKAKVEAKDGAK